MSRDAIGLALVEWVGDTYLCETPPYAKVKDMDVVFKPSEGNEIIGHCINAVTIYDEDDFKFIIDAMNATLPLRKVISVVEYSPLKYPEEEYKCNN